MELITILANALLDISRVDKTAGANDGAYRKQMRIILNSPSVQYALARARDAPAGSTAPAEPKPARKRKPKETPTA